MDVEQKGEKGGWRGIRLRIKVDLHGSTGREGDELVDGNEGDNNTTSTRYLRASLEHRHYRFNMAPSLSPHCERHATIQTGPVIRVETDGIVERGG